MSAQKSLETAFNLWNEINLIVSFEYFSILTKGIGSFSTGVIHSL